MKAALYARYSTESQSEDSIPDQFRTLERVARQHGFEICARFQDEAISAGTAVRPGYQAMLAAARAGELQVIVCEDVSRLWRNRAEFGPRSCELEDLGVHLVTAVGDDTRRDGWGLTIQVKQMIAESQRREASYRTKRGLEGRARQQRSAGGRAYGYLAEKDSPTGERAVHPERAAVVREIFERFVAGETLRAIASSLNDRRIPSPGAAWKRTARASDGLWRVSALHAILHNEIYAGRLIWNRTRWVRSARDSKDRRCIENPREDWIVHERPDLAIVDPLTFTRAQQRLQERATLFAPGPGGRTTYLLSGLLRCAVCGGPFVVGAHRPVRYLCSTRRTAGDSACPNGMAVRQDIAEERILDTITEGLLSPAAVEHAVRTMRAQALAQAQAPVVDVAHLDRQIAHLEQASAAGVLSAEIAGPALAEARRKRAAAMRRPAATPGVFGAETAYREAVRDMRETLRGESIPAAREALRSILGPIRLHPQGDHLLAELSAGSMALAVNWIGSGGRI